MVTGFVQVPPTRVVATTDACYGIPHDDPEVQLDDKAKRQGATGYTRQGLKPCHRSLIAGLAEAKLIANYWLRSGNSACVNGAAEFLRQTVTSLPRHIRLGLVRGDAGFGDASVQAACAALRLKYIFVAKLTQKVQSLCRHGMNIGERPTWRVWKCRRWNWSNLGGA